MSNGSKQGWEGEILVFPFKKIGAEGANFVSKLLSQGTGSFQLTFLFPSIFSFSVYSYQYKVVISEGS